MPYDTLDWIYDLTPSQMAGAVSLQWTVYDKLNDSGWDHQASSVSFATTPPEVFRFDAIAGATYDMVASSFYDPFFIRVYDSAGNAIWTEPPEPYGTYGYDYIVDWIAPYSGTFYVGVSFNQGAFSKTTSVLILEDRDPAPAIYGDGGFDFIFGTSRAEFISTLEGFDVVMPGEGNDTVDGGADVDTMRMLGKVAEYVVSVDGGTITSRDTVPMRDGTDSFVNVERLFFDDHRLAFDMDGRAGFAAKTMGAVLGAAAVENPEWVGIALDMVDGVDGMGYEQLIGAALDLVLGPAPSHAAVVTLLYTNVMGTAPDAGTLAAFVAVLDAGLFTHATLAMAAADTGQNAENIDLVGLAAHGLLYD